MSTYTLEGILHNIQANPAFRERFIADASAALADQPLTDEERRELLAWDVQAMSRRGVSDMLQMTAFTMINGQQAMPEYMRRMNGLRETA